MTRKAKGWLSFMALAVVAPPAIWFVTRFRVPIEFLGEEPVFTFMFPDEFKGKPWIDWKAPGGQRITFPTKRKLASGAPDHAVAGYMAFPPRANATGSTLPFGIPGDNIAIEGSPSAMPIALIESAAPLPATTSVTGSSLTMSAGTTVFTSPILTS